MDRPATYSARKLTVIMEDDTIKVGIDLLDILLHHALRASRDGAFVLEILSKFFKTTGEANAKSIEQKVLDESAFVCF